MTPGNKPLALSAIATTLVAVLLGIRAVSN